MGLQINKALVVDDSRLARIALSKLLEKRRLAVDTAGCGGEAVDYLKGEKPDVIFMDYMMPDMDGFSAAQMILNNPATADIPVIMYTSQDSDEDRARAAEIGICGFLGKPTTEDALDQLLRRLRTTVPESVAEEEHSAAEVDSEEELPQLAEEGEHVPETLVDEDVVLENEVAIDDAEVAALESDEPQFASELEMSDGAASVDEEALRAFAREAAESVASEAVARLEYSYESRIDELRRELTEVGRGVADTAAEEAARRVVESVAREQAETVAEAAVNRLAGDVAEQAATRVAQELIPRALEGVVDSVKAELRGQVLRLLEDGDLKVQIKARLIEEAVPALEPAVRKAAEAAAEDAVASVLDNLIGDRLAGLEAGMEAKAAELLEPRLAAVNRRWTRVGIALSLLAVAVAVGVSYFL